MQFKQGAEVFSADNHSVGRIDRVVLDPETKEVTHLVIRNGVLLTEDKVVPLSLIPSSLGPRLNLLLNADEVDSLPQFEEKSYVPVNETELARRDAAEAPAAPLPNFYWYPIPGYPVPPAVRVPGYVAETERNIPEEMVALKAGARVVDSEGETVGHVEQVFTDARTDQVSHFVVSHGLLLKERKLVPVTWVHIIADEEIHLNVPGARVETLPVYEPAGD